ncbi:MAG: GAF domain-containing sensor histidine kinase [Caldilineaceae bacterium]|nr:GAF domain-containing sensor histidine kinase [Caldilineaceae bacterium]
MLNSPSLISALCELNKLIEDRLFDRYWQRGVELLCRHVKARAVSLSLLEPLYILEQNNYRAGEWPPELDPLLQEWQRTFIDKRPHPVTWHIQDDGSQLVHVRIMVEQMHRGCVSFLFPPDGFVKAEQSVLYDLIQLFAGNALRASYMLDAQERFERANLLYMVTQDLTSSLDLHTVLNQATHMAASVLNAEASTLYRIDFENRELIFMITQGSAAQKLEEKRMPMDRGIVGWVAQNGTSIIVNDVEHSVLHDPAMDAQTGFRTRSILCVPLRIKERTIGVLQVLNKADQVGFTDEDKNWLAIMGQQVAISLENARLFAREQEKVSELATLNELSQTINSELDVSAILNKITHSILEILSADRSELLLVRPNSRRLELRASAGHRAEGVEQPRQVFLNERISDWCLHHRGDRATYRNPIPWATSPELQQSAIAAAPLMHRDRIIGIIVVYSLSGQLFSQEKRDLLQTFAHQAAIALRNAELYQNLRVEQERIIRAQEEIRHRIARDLHDNTAQMLSLIIMNLDLVRQMLSRQQMEKVFDEIDRLEEYGRQANREVRTLLFELRPITLESRGLISAIESYHRQLTRSTQLKINVGVNHIPDDIPPKAANAIFSIIQEAVNNVRKHAAATEIWLSIHVDNGQFSLAIEDDGSGFDYDAVLEKYDELGSFGMLNMNERTTLLGGKLEVLSPRPDGENGTRISVIVPLVNLYEQESSKVK